MNYQKIYNILCSRSFERSTDTNEIYEKHHIIPKCIGGSDNQENIAILTAREHFIAHKLLCEIYPENKKLHYALWAMMNLNNNYQNRKYIISSREYNRARNIYIKLQSKPKSIEHKKKISNSWTVKRRKDASKRLSEYNKNRIHPLLGKKRTELVKQKISKALQGRECTLETRQKIRKSLTGCTASDETKQKMRMTAAQRKLIKCPHCTMESKSMGNMNRYHFNNCKYINMEK
jgi:hypothetical protein